MLDGSIDSLATTAFFLLLIYLILIWIAFIKFHEIILLLDWRFNSFTLLEQLFTQFFKRICNMISSFSTGLSKQTNTIVFHEPIDLLLRNSILMQVTHIS